MASPYMALQVQGPAELQQQANVVQNGQLVNKLQQQKVQEQQIALNDQKASSAAIQQWDPSTGLDGIPSLIKQNGGSATAVLGAAKAAQEWTAAHLKMSTEQVDLQAKKNDALLGQLTAVTSDPSPGLSGRVATAAQQAVQQGVLDPQHFLDTPARRRLTQRRMDIGDPVAGCGVAVAVVEIDL